MLTSPGPAMILWVWAREWFIRSLSAGLLSVRAIRVRIIVSKVLGALQHCSEQSELCCPELHLSTILSRDIFMLRRPRQPHPTPAPWIVFGEFYPALTIRHDDWAGEESYNFSIKLWIRWWIPWPGHSWHLTSWSWQWHPSRDPGPDMSI